MTDNKRHTRVIEFKGQEYFISSHDLEFLREIIRRWKAAASA